MKRARVQSTLTERLLRNQKNDRKALLAGSGPPSGWCAEQLVSCQHSNPGDEPEERLP